MCWIMLASLSKCLFLLNDPDGTNNIMSCAHGEKLNQFHCSVMPILKSYQIQESVPVVKLYSVKEWNTFPQLEIF